MTNSIKSQWVTLTLLLFSAEMLQANIVLSVPDTDILPNAPGQTLWIYAVNDSLPVSLLGLGLNLQIADGGPAAGGVISGPSITDIDIFSPKVLFGSNNNGQGGSGSLLPQIYEAATLTQSGYVQLNQGTFIIGSVTLDTTGFSLYGQTWELSLESLNGPSELFGSDGNPLSVLLRPSILTMVPEPTVFSMSLAGFSIFLLTRGGRKCLRVLGANLRID